MKMLKIASLVCLSAAVLSASSLKDAIENATLDGWVRGKYFYSDGRDGSGQGYQMFFLPTIHSGEVNGYSLSVGVFAAYGPGVPDAVTSDNAIGGSRAPRIDQSSAPDVFNISNLYINKTFESTKTTIRLGQMNIVSALNAGTTWGDRGLGGMITNEDITGIKLYISAYDSWMTDNIMLMMNEKGTIGIGNNLVIMGIESNKGLPIKGLGFKLYYSWAQKLYDLMMFGDVHYKYDFDNGLSVGVLGQVAGTVMNDSEAFHTKGKALGSYFSLLRDGTSYGGIAKTRGIFNLQANLKFAGYTTKLGYIGSFGQGYGTMLDSKGGFDVGGQLWNGIIAGGIMGFGWTGTGSVKNTGLQAVYFTHKYQFHNGFGLGLDLVWVGNGYDNGNRFPYMRQGSERLRDEAVRSKAAGMPIKNRGGVIPARSTNLTQDSELFEISPQISYKFTKDFSGSLVYSQLVGDMLMGRGVVTLKYNF
ncbi:hypothetical protein BKH42_06075 [Helicobacter sp. 13S00482-2]|uniref:hypothetical protein n=1 Tax=Helicobacter sp. 13S00482-2 TaxID=1476200 RepID=UPI000BA530DC|nr:hypothetical protein [Helicobacter sp. 13S00482-2]PAF53384.1 hypothetical protein BKH42_06075 [Helicobacter sp. 13S00482-2]